MKIIFYSICFIFFSLLVMADKALAMDCYVDPVRQFNVDGKTVSGAFLRNNACMGDSVILTTLPANAAVKVIGETDGWYKVEYSGARGWVGSQLMTLATSSPTIKIWDSYHEFEQSYPSKKGIASASSSVKPSIDQALVSRLKGYILLQTQSHGEAWYLNSTDGSRYYMKDGAAAYQMMRSFGLGVTEGDYAKIASGDYALKSRLRGRIVLRVQEHGEAYYIHPKDLAVYYLKDGESAYNVMRYNSLGITDTDLSKIPSNEIPIK
ncbi:MAG: SH3 domain-containing protein [Patescibacteria group bacterium]